MFKAFKSNKKITILHTPMTYDLSKLILIKLYYLKNLITSGYSNHNNDFNTLNILSAAIQNVYLFTANHLF